MSRHRHAALLLLAAATLAAGCAREAPEAEGDSAAVPAIAVPVSDSAADSASREADEIPTVSPPASPPADPPMVRPAKPRADTARPVAQRADSILIRLERTACLGGCPVYTVSLTGDGSVRYEGREHVVRTGTATAKVTPSAARGIVDAARAGGFFSLADRYAYGEPTCPLYASDSPRAFISITADGRTKRIEHDYGCENVPRVLAALAGRIDSVAGAERWLGAR